MESKMARCRRKAEVEEHLSDRALMKQIRRVDKNRAKYYEYYTGQKWGARENYDLCVNTSNVDIKELAEAIAKLPASYREALLLRYDNGFTVREIAGLLGITESGVRKLLGRAKQTLQQLLEEEGIQV
jgi:RNA polymerase sigma factor (sigma-70 family)